ncbi:hypothetical protein LCN96_11405 [Nonomuraea gerenzanensis]|nr:hypothetical protein LCN96_11405 [Nonomuraea gerenzanensis]
MLIRRVMCGGRPVAKVAAELGVFCQCGSRRVRAGDRTESWAGLRLRRSSLRSRSRHTP